MDHKLSQIPFSRNSSADNLSRGGNEPTESFRRVVGQFILGNSGHTSQVLQPSVDQPSGSVATELATSVVSSRDYMITPSAIKAESHDLPPLNVKKRPAESPTFSRKRRRHSYSSSQILGRSQTCASKETPKPYKN
ncbi:hypothetical protein PCH_Pc23g00820 [Penicillium rubens Wisconsin 54-1255]|uniref:Uncharacterized protein n=1 Tax=Penicillium rubens (strain ATCC 28089 / DSM 1075 / NRRL 1951 / Wisconsin 54-1255) TaxID=500485 RepID=B6HWD2_PENRW|nr:hypothetical protein PCH_Pc23g00820 [Penicillium rubens Wisconsin 54-1255]